MTKKNLLLRFILPLLLAMVLGAVVLKFYTYHTRPAELSLTGVDLAPFSDEKSGLLKPELLAISQPEYSAMLAATSPEAEQTLAGECQRWAEVLPSWLLCDTPGYLLNTDSQAQFKAPNQLIAAGSLSANALQSMVSVYRIERDPEAEGSLISRLDIYEHDDGVPHYYRYDTAGKLINRPLSEMPQPIAYVEEVVNPTLQPTLRFTFSNRGARDATLTRIRSERIFVVFPSAQAGYLGEQLPPRVTLQAPGISLGPDNDESVTLADPVVIQPEREKALEVPVNILDLGKGDTPGYLLVRFLVDYSDGSQQRTALLGNFLFTDHVLLPLGE
ncbi:hypothetical protein KDD30_22990 (plasmid) [Photobacterium sp. GJ3]|uniref:hypothetical protein n=1 Tax=Photobacterium sp. GJ3 TaxID=2829502 RepID=UPI001B8C2DBA|nr:hypothetical protein [Photobacterium sp. GJ3]QUJ69606.1 hypothetical protein KDD30_22990 [Photobacterium sp. GJ3]